MQVYIIISIDDLYFLVIQLFWIFLLHQWFSIMVRGRSPALIVAVLTALLLTKMQWSSSFDGVPNQIFIWFFAYHLLTHLIIGLVTQGKAGRSYIREFDYHAAYHDVATHGGVDGRLENDFWGSSAGAHWTRLQLSTHKPQFVLDVSIMCWGWGRAGFKIREK